MFRLLFLFLFVARCFGQATVTVVPKSGSAWEFLSMPSETFPLPNPLFGLALVVASPSDACAPVTPVLQQPFAMLVLRGNCTWDVKMANSAKAGAQAVIVADTVYAAYSWSNASVWPKLAPPDGVCRTNCEDAAAYVESNSVGLDSITTGFTESSCAKSSKCSSGTCALTGQRDPNGGAQICCILESYVDMYAEKPAAIIPAVFASISDGNRLLATLRDSPISVQISPPHTSVDASAVVLWLWGVLVVTSACLYAALRESRQPAVAHSAVNRPPEEEEHVNITSTGALAYLALAVAALIGMFFLLKAFPRLIVLFLIGAYSLASFTALLLVVFIPLFKKHFPAWNTWKTPEKLPLLGATAVSSIAAALASFTVVTFWVVTRHQSWAWVLQDLLGFVLVCYFFRIVRLNSIKVSYVLLWCFLLYDFFMVFLSPLLFHSCVMCAVATAGQGSAKESPTDPSVCDRTPDEHMPMIFLIPRKRWSATGMGTSYAILGLGDVVLPGLLLTFALRYDCARIHARVGSAARSAMGMCGFMKSLVYFIPSVLGYVFGLLCAFLANSLGLTINGVQGQPALLYLVPCTTLPFTFAALYRGEFRKLWAGPMELLHPRDDYATSSDDVAVEDTKRLIV